MTRAFWKHLQGMVVLTVSKLAADLGKSENPCKNILTQNVRSRSMSLELGTGALPGGSDFCTEENSVCCLDRTYFPLNQVGFPVKAGYWIFLINKNLKLKKMLHNMNLEIEVNEDNLECEVQRILT